MQKRPQQNQPAEGNAIRVPHAECLSYCGEERTIAVAVSDTVIKIIDLLLVPSNEIGVGKAGRRRRQKSHIRMRPVYM